MTTMHYLQKISKKFKKYKIHKQKLWYLNIEKGWEI